LEKRPHLNEFISESFTPGAILCLVATTSLYPAFHPGQGMRNYFYSPYLKIYVQSRVQYLPEDDNSYAYTVRINSLQQVYLILQDFHFTFPSIMVANTIGSGDLHLKFGMIDGKIRSPLKNSFAHFYRSLTQIRHSLIPAWKTTLNG